MKDDFAAEFAARAMTAYPRFSYRVITIFSRAVNASSLQGEAPCQIARTWLVSSGKIESPGAALRCFRIINVRVGPLPQRGRAC
jgi:hypothetical protein